MPQECSERAREGISHVCRSHKAPAEPAKHGQHISQNRGHHVLGIATVTAGVVCLPVGLFITDAI